MEYLEQAKKEIRENWFEKHIVKKIEGQDGFQRIIWGEEGSRMYQVEYVLSGNMVFVSGNLGDAAYSLTCQATLDNIKGFNLSHFTGKLTAHQRERWHFDDKVAREQIESYFLDWCEVDKTEDLEEDEKELFNELISATMEWSDYKAFETMGVWTAYHNTNVDWFDSETASIVADCGKRLGYSFIAYWLGLQMVIEQIEAQEKQSA